MKLHMLTWLIVATMSACLGQSATEQAKKMEAAINDAPKPGTIATTTSGWTMRANINGKPWRASSMMPPALAGVMIGYVGEGSYLMMYCFKKRSAEVGKRARLGDGYSVDYWIKGGPVYSNYSGTMEITAINGNWAEGRFQFKAAGLDVTDGFYRVELK